MKNKRGFFYSLFLHLTVLGMIFSIGGNSAALAFQYKSKTPDISEKIREQQAVVQNDTSDPVDARRHGWTAKNRGGGIPGLGTVSGSDAGTESEPNNTSADADPLGADPDVKIKGNIFPNADVDFYSFTTTMPNTRVYAAVMTAWSASASTDSFLEIRDSDGTTVLESDNDDGTFSTTSSSIAGLNLAAAGTYYVFVRHNLATSQIRPYFLYLSTRSGAPIPEVEANDTVGTANIVPASGHISGSLSSAADVDFFSIPLNAGDTVYASLDMDPERDTTTWNGGLGIGGFNGFILTVNDGNTVSPNSEAQFMTVQDAGTYFILVNAPAASFGTYNLSVTVIPETNPSGGCTVYTSTDVPQTIPATAPPILVSSTLTIPDNRRIEKMRVFIDLDHTFMADLDVHLRSPAGNDNGLFTDIGNTSLGPPAGLGDMDITLDDDYAIPISSFTVQAAMGWQPELNYRLDWFHGENAMGTWTLDIRDDASGDGGTLNSWGIEVCEAPAPAGILIYDEDFESNDGGYTHSGTNDEWEYGLPNTVINSQNVITTCNSGTNCWKTDLDSTYNASSNQDLVSIPINLTQFIGTINLTWAMRYSMESASFDHARVIVREVGNPGNNRTVWEWNGATMNNTVGSTPAVTISETAGWGTYNADISDFAGLPIELVFHVDTDNTVQLAGMAIDDVQLRYIGPVAANASVGGRVLSPQGTGIPQTIVSLTDDDGVTRTARTNPFGYFRFGNVGVGQNYTINASRKGYEFQPQVIFVGDDVTGLTIVASDD
jgi:subtilisin-like proprotein convertase family protein